MCYRRELPDVRSRVTIHLWIPFIDQPQSEVVVFAMITFHIYTILVKKRKYGIGPNNIFSFNEEL